MKPLLKYNFRGLSLNSYLLLIKTLRINRLSIVKISIIIFTTCLFFSCQVTPSTQYLNHFFDLNDFFQKEISRISNVRKIKKKVSVNGRTEEMTLEDFDLKKDLEIFTNSNINKIALLDKYRVDSIFHNNTLTRIEYNAIDEKVKTRKLIVNFTNKKVESISILNVSSNTVASAEQNLLYQTNKGYSMKSKQKVSLSDEQTRSVEVEFLF